MKRKTLTQAEADSMAEQNEEFLHSRQYNYGDFEAQSGERADFEKMDLSGLNFFECSFDEVNFKNAKLHGTEFRYCTFDSAHFYKADLQNAVFYGCTLDRINLVKSSCRQTHFVDCKIRDASLSHADLRNTEFWGSDLENSDLKNAIINRRANPDQFRNVNAAGIRNNNYVKHWLQQQAYIAEFKVYHPVMSWFWKWSADYGRSAWYLIVWFIVTTLLYGSVYTFTEIFFFEEVSPVSGYVQAALMMIPFGYFRMLADSWPGEIVLLSQAAIGYLLLISIGLVLINKFRL